jgi:hypothetical protein
MDEPLGVVLARALDAAREEQPPPALAAKPAAKALSLHELAKRDDATAFIRAYRAKYKD